jgi:phosphohistidine phosphatase
MKTLYCCRHAKSSWSMHHLPDIDRPLNERGYGDAHQMAQQFTLGQPNPTLLISSTATRALSTAMIFARHLQYNTAQIQLSPNLYESSVAHYLDLIACIDDAHEVVMLFGHNNVISDMVMTLTGFPISLATAGLVKITFDISNWMELYSSKGDLVYYKYPKQGTLS